MGAVAANWLEQTPGLFCVNPVGHAPVFGSMCPLSVVLFWPVERFVAELVTTPVVGSVLEQTRILFEVEQDCAPAVGSAEAVWRTQPLGCR